MEDTNAYGAYGEQETIAPAAGSYSSTFRPRDSEQHDFSAAPKTTSYHLPSYSAKVAVPHKNQRSVQKPGGHQGNAWSTSCKSHKVMTPAYIPSYAPKVVVPHKKQRSVPKFGGYQRNSWSTSRKSHKVMTPAYNPSGFVSHRPMTPAYNHSGLSNGQNCSSPPFSTRSRALPKGVAFTPYYEQQYHFQVNNHELDDRTENISFTEAQAWSPTSPQYTPLSPNYQSSPTRPKCTPLSPNYQPGNFLENQFSNASPLNAPQKEKTNQDVGCFVDSNVTNNNDNMKNAVDSVGFDNRRTGINESYSVGALPNATKNRGIKNYSTRRKGAKDSTGTTKSSITELSLGSPKNNDRVHENMQENTKEEANKVVSPLAYDPRQPQYSPTYSPDPFHLQNESEYNPLFPAWDD